jgi:hypothetical protein
MSTSKFKVSWFGRTGHRYPAYWVNGVRVSVQAGYQFAMDNGVKLNQKFHTWHEDNR